MENRVKTPIVTRAGIKYLSCTTSWVLALFWIDKEGAAPILISISDWALAASGTKMPRRT